MALAITNAANVFLPGKIFLSSLEPGETSCYRAAYHPSPMGRAAKRVRVKEREAIASTEEKKKQTKQKKGPVWVKINGERVKELQISFFFVLHSCTNSA